MSRWSIYAEEISHALGGRFTMTHCSAKYIEYVYQHHDSLYVDKGMFYIEVSADRRCRKAGVVRMWSETRKDGVHKKLFDLLSVPLQYLGAIFDAWLDQVNDLTFPDTGLSKDQYVEFDQTMHEAYSNIVMKRILAQDLKLDVENPSPWIFDYDKTNYTTRVLYKLDATSVLSLRRMYMPGTPNECYQVIANIPVNKRSSSIHFPLVPPKYVREFCDSVIYLCEHEMRRVGTIDEQVFTRCGFPSGNQKMRCRLKLNNVVDRYHTQYGYRMRYPQFPH